MPDADASPMQSTDPRAPAWLKVNSSPYNRWRLTRGCGIEPETLRILLGKPERISGFDNGLVARVASAVGDRRAALLEIAGRDSVAAGLTAASSGRYDLLIPTVVYTGTEYGDWDVVLNNAEALAGRLRDRRQVDVLETVVLGSPVWWHAVAARFSGELSRLYGFSTTCIACHMYVHAARVPFARATGATAVIAGERLSHDGRRKLNQLKPCLRTYRAVLAEQGIELDMPLESLQDGKRLEELVGPGWAESGRQMRCILEGNYRDVSGEITAREQDLEEYLGQFLAPAFQAILSSFIRGDAPPDYLALAGEAFSSVLERRSG